MSSSSNFPKHLTTAFVLKIFSFDFINILCSQFFSFFIQAKPISLTSLVLKHLKETSSCFLLSLTPIVFHGVLSIEMT